MVHPLNHPEGFAQEVRHEADKGTGESVYLAVGKITTREKPNYRVDFFLSHAFLTKTIATIRTISIRPRANHK